MNRSRRLPIINTLAFLVGMAVVAFALSVLILLGGA